MVTKSDIIHYAPLRIFDEIEAPYSLPPGSKTSRPYEIVGQSLAETCIKRRIADLEGQILALCDLILKVEAEGKVLAEV